jgi:thiamine biosynthesis protein ThiS
VIRVGDKQVPWKEGMTVSALLADMRDGHFYAVVRLNGKLVSRPYFNSTLIPDNAEVILIPMVAGG